MKITVTQEDIENGEPRRCSLCPIALAISRAFTHGEFISIGAGGFWSINGERQPKLPKIVEDWIRSFDKNETVEPFKFTINEQ